MSCVETSLTKLTAEELRTLRKCRSFVARHGWHNQRLGKHEFGNTDCVLSGFRNGSDQPRISVVAEESQIKDYTAYPTGTEHQRSYQACCTIQYSHAEAFQTLLKLAKPGDYLAFEWLRNNDSDNLRAAGIEHDQLWVEILRLDEDQDRKSIGKVCAGDSLTPVRNELARLIRVTG